MNLSKSYEPGAYEEDVYRLWEESKAFEPSGSGDPFCIIMPPPNANAKLHIGQATYAKQDVMARYQRMAGRKVLYSPGADHAGFETWYVYEKKLAAEGKSRFDFSDGELYDQTYDFVASNMHLAQGAFRMMGFSCAWSNFTFTLDDKVVEGVRKVFKRMWDDGLVYRGERLVNYCTQHRTSFSDIEVEYEDRDDTMYHIAYPFTDGDGEIVVATVRPETMFGDVAVAVNPDDDRYTNFIGRKVRIPLTDIEVEVIADDAVETGFGSGALKITPGHSVVDWEIAQKRELGVVPVIGLDGKMLDGEIIPKALHGLSIEEARLKSAEMLKEEGLLRLEEPYTHSVGVCYKCRTVIEPMLMEQWFVKMKPLAAKAIEAIKKDEVKFVPERRKEMGLEFLEGIRDWNISRQCPWGIRIPAFLDPTTGEWIFNESEEDEIEIDGKTYFRDRDTFDTWMSSSQFPYLSLGWPEGELYKEYYPTSWLHLGRDIFGFWGLRMIMMGLLNTGQVPFKTLYINGTIRGEDGRKMSKSIGNGIMADSLIEEYGSDATRMGMISIDDVAGADKTFDRSKIVAGRNFANKIWNIARFVEGLLDEHRLSINDLGALELKSDGDEWIVEKLSEGSKKVADLIQQSEFGAAFSVVYDLVWNSFADWYLEFSKKELNLSVLIWGMETILKIAHPFAPFVTETIWQTLNFREGEDLLAVESWPEPVKFNKEGSARFTEVITAVEFARKVKAFVGAEMEISTDDDVSSEAVKFLAKLKPDESKLYGSSLTVPNLDGWSLLLEAEQMEVYREQIGKRIDEVQDEITRLRMRLENKAYVEKAPEKLVKESEDRLESLKEELRELKSE